VCTGREWHGTHRVQVVCTACAWGVALRAQGTSGAHSVRVVCTGCKWHGVHRVRVAWHAQGASSMGCTQCEWGAQGARHMACTGCEWCAQGVSRMSCAGCEWHCVRRVPVAWQAQGVSVVHRVPVACMACLGCKWCAQGASSMAYTGSEWCAQCASGVHRVRVAW
jgi:hypothetical protein